MIECSVLRCTNPVTGDHSAAGFREAYICAEHKALIDVGASWDMDESIVLMGRDLAPLLEYWSARPSAGSEGFTLSCRSPAGLNPLKFS